MSHYDRRPQRGYDPRSSSPISQARTYVNSEAGSNNYDSYDNHQNYYNQSQYRPQNASSHIRNHYHSRSLSTSPDGRSRTYRTSRRQSEPQRLDGIAKVGIVIGALAVIAGTMHLLSSRERRRREQQVAYQRERAAAEEQRERKRRRRRREEEEEERWREEEERRRDEVEEWRERGRRGAYIEGPRGWQEGRAGDGESVMSSRSRRVG